MKYKRVLLKLSGEILEGKQTFGIEKNSLNFLSNEIKKVVDKNVEIGVVIGGGNIFRGAKLVDKGFIDRINGDYMGMLATVINGLALTTSLKNLGIKSKLITSIKIDKIGELYNQDSVLNYLEDGYVLIFSGGTSNPFFTTDSAAALRAIEINADIILKGTKVDGVFTSDPAIDKSAIKYNKISFDEVYENKLRVMDLTAFTLCKENKMPIRVFDINQNGALFRAIEKGDIGTLIQ